MEEESMNKKEIVVLSKDIDFIVETMGELPETSDLIEDYAYPLNG